MVKFPSSLSILFVLHLCLLPTLPARGAQPPPAPATPPATPSAPSVNNASVSNRMERALRVLRTAMTNPAPAAAAAPATSAPTTVQPSAPAPIPQIPAIQPPSVRPRPLPSSARATNVAAPSFPAFPPLPAIPGQPPAPGSVAPQPGISTLPAPAPNLNPNPNLPGISPASISASTLWIQGMAIDQFFDEVYSPISGRTIIRPYALQGAPQGITVKAHADLSIAEAVFLMDAVLAQNEIAMIPIGEKFVKAVPMAKAAQEGADLALALTNSLVPQDQFITQVVELKTMRPSEVAPLLQTFSKVPNGITAFDANQTIVIRDSALNVKRMLELIARMDIPRDPDYKLEVIPVKYGKVGDLYNTMASLISGQISSGGTSGTTGAARSTGRNARGSRGGSNTGQFGQQNMNRLGQTLQPQQAATTVGGGQASFQNRLQQIVSRAAQGEQVEVLGDARIVPDERSNRLLIFANKRDMDMITNIVHKVDILLAQVLIEAIILEVQLGDSKSLGVSMVQHPQRFGADFTGAGVINNGQPFLSGITNFPGAVPGGLSYFGKIGNDMDVAVNAIAQNNKINVVSRPRIQTSHAIPGNFFIGETVPYVTGTTDYGFYGGGLGGGSVGYPSRSQIQQLDVGLDLMVTPFITPDGLVVMEIEQTADQRGADVIIDNNPIPIISRRGASSTLTVRDGQTIILGGFISDSKSKSSSGVPVLKDIPLLGALFRTKRNENDRRELVILMRAKVLETPEDAAFTATAERSQLPGIQSAEREFEELDRKRSEKARRNK